MKFPHFSSLLFTLSFAFVISTVLFVGFANAQVNPAIAAPKNPDARPYIVTLKDDAVDPDAIIGTLQARIAKALSRTHTFRSAIKGFSTSITPADAAALAKDPMVQSVVPDG